MADPQHPDIAALTPKEVAMRLFDDWYTSFDEPQIPVAYQEALIDSIAAALRAARAAAVEEAARVALSPEQISRALYPASWALIDRYHDDDDWNGSTSVNARSRNIEKATEIIEALAKAGYRIVPADMPVRDRNWWLEEAARVAERYNHSDLAAAAIRALGEESAAPREEATS